MKISALRVSYKPSEVQKEIKFYNFVIFIHHSLIYLFIYL